MIDEEALAAAMQRWGLLETPVPPAARRWIHTFVQAYDRIASVDDAKAIVASLRAESCLIPALELERLRSRDALFFLDSVAQYVDHLPDLRDLPVEEDLQRIAADFGMEPSQAVGAVRMAVSGQDHGPPLHLLFPLLGHDRILIRIGAVSSRLLHGRGLEPIAFGPGGEPFEPIRGTPPADRKQPS